MAEIYSCPMYVMYVLYIHIHIYANFYTFTFLQRTLGMGTRNA